MYIPGIPIYDSRHIACYRDTKTGNLSFKLMPPNKYIPHTYMEVLYEIPDKGYFRAKRRLSHYFDYKVYHDLRTGDERAPRECREIIEECAMALARADAAFKYCHLGRINVMEVRI